MEAGYPVETGGESPARGVNQDNGETCSTQTRVAGMYIWFLSTESETTSLRNSCNGYKIRDSC